MRPLELRLKSDPGQRLDLSFLTPNNLANMSEYDIANIAVGTAKKPVTLGEAFTITEGDRSGIWFSGLTSGCDYVGDSMESGTITVEGDAGAYAGARMRGGKIEISGSTGDYAGASMKGGELSIRGNTGSHAGGRHHAENQGIRGGMLRVGGNAGDHAAERMRRGVVIIDGNVGDYAAARMIAGTCIISGQHGQTPGYGMRRGTLVLNSTNYILPTFADCGMIDLPILSMMRRHFETINAGTAIRQSNVRRFAGDMAALGRGEILVQA